MRNGAIVRIAMWTIAGFLISAGWGLYFATANKANPIEPAVYTLARLTQPVVAVTLSYFDFPHGLSWTVAANAASYALAGLIVEGIRKRLHHAN